MRDPVEFPVKCPDLAMAKVILENLRVAHPLRLLEGADLLEDEVVDLALKAEAGRSHKGPLSQCDPQGNDVARCYHSSVKAV